jgi:predicted N-acetyltransferase YhbS
MQSNDELQVRPARPDDRAAIREVSLAAFGQYATIMTPDHWAHYREHLLETLAATDAPFFVAELGGEIVGSVRLVPPKAMDATSARPGDAWPEVSILAVSPQVRGKGIASALLDECMRQARAMGATTLGLHTDNTMQVALGLYGRRGFVRVPETDFHPMPGVHVMGFRRPLDDIPL